MTQRGRRMQGIKTRTFSFHSVAGKWQSSEAVWKHSQRRYSLAVQFLSRYTTLIYRRSVSRKTNEAKSSVLKSQSTFYINEYEPLHFASAIKPSIIMCEPLPALCKSHRSNIKPCFHFLLQSCGIIRGYAIWRSLLITPVARQWTRCYPHMLSQLLYLHCGLPLWNNDFRNCALLMRGAYIRNT